jgi:hypothetical protein
LEGVDTETDVDKGAELLRMIEEFAAEDYKTSN